MQNAIIVGVNGTIGAPLFGRFKSLGLQVIGTTRRRDQVADGIVYLDLADDPGKWPPLPAFEVAYLCSAIGRLDPCENDPKATHLINVDRTIALARRLHAAGSFIVFLSTNQVFDGTRPLSKANDKPHPINEYGRQKVETEKALLALKCAAVLRITKVISQPFSLFEQWKKSLLQHQAIKGFDDLYVAPMPIERVIEALTFIGQKKQPGLFQISGPRDVSYYTLALSIAKELGVDPKLVIKASAVAEGLPSNFIPRHTTLVNTGLGHLHIKDAEDVARMYVRNSRE